MTRRTAIAIAAATLTTLGTGAVTAAAMSGGEVLGLGHDGPRIEVLAPPTTIDDSSPTSTRRSETEIRSSSDDTSTTTRTTAPTTTRTTDDNPGRSTTTTPPTTRPPAASPTVNTATFRSVGGEVDVTWTARALSIVAVRPAAGFRTQNEEQEGDEIEAEFESGAHNSKITVRLVDGVPTASVRERDDNDRIADDNSSADDNSNSGHGSESNDDHGGSGRG